MFATRLFVPAFCTSLYFLLSLSLGFGLAVAPPAEADQKIYWIDRAALPKIARSSVNGSAVETLIEQPDVRSRPLGMAVDPIADKLYWTDVAPQSIRRANRDGTGVETLIDTGLSIPRGIALDPTNGKMYWTDSGRHTIERANLDGTGREVLVSSLAFALSLALDVAGGKLYWVEQGSSSNTGKVSRSNLDGTAVEHLVINENSPTAIALDLVNDHVYWRSGASSVFRRSNMDGTGLVSLFSESGFINELYVDSTGKLYWLNISTGHVLRANLDGTSKEIVMPRPSSITNNCGTSSPFSEAFFADFANRKLLLGSTAFFSGMVLMQIDQANLDGSVSETLLPFPNPILCRPRGIAVDEGAGKMYWTEEGVGSVMRANLDGTSIERIMQGFGCCTFDVAVDPRNGKIYWTDGLGVRVLRANGDGSNVEILADLNDLPNMRRPTGITLDLVNQKIYWADNQGFDPATGTSFGALHRANLDGSLPETIRPAGISGPVGIAVDPAAAKLYWGEVNSSIIGRAKLDGTSAEDFLDVGRSQNLDLEFDSALDKLYWTNPSEVGRVNFDGTGREIVRRGFALSIGLGEAVPVADAGPDQTVNEDELVTLDGSGSTGDGDPLTIYNWQQVGGPPVIGFETSDPLHPTFTAPLVAIGGETVTFELVVGDGVDFSDADLVDITIVNVNNPPVADAGDPQSVPEGTLVTLDAKIGTNSFDTDGDPLTCEWSQTVGTPVTLNTPMECVTTFTAPSLVPAAGEVLTFSLTVDDGFDTDTDTVDIEVTHVNQPPVADAGGPGPIPADEGTQVTLDGTGSTDPEDSVPTNFLWEQIAGPTVILADANTSLATFEAPPVMAGGEDLTFRLTVDDTELNDTDQVIIRVRNINDPPDCSIARPSDDVLWPPNHKYRKVSIANLADPDAGDEIMITITSILQDEPVNGLGDGDTSPDALIDATDPMVETVLLRSERGGDLSGRVYHIAFAADDGFEGCEGEVLVSVPHDRKGSPAEDGGALHDSTMN